MRWLWVGCLWLLAGGAWAHKPSDSYLSLEVREAVVEGQWDIAIRDLDFALGLDANQDREITWGELRGRHRDIEAYALARLTLAADGAACPARAEAHLVDDHSDGAYAVLRFRAVCPQAPAALAVGYRLFFDLDRQHKGLARVTHDGRTTQAVFSAAEPERRIVLREAGVLEQFGDYVRHGVWHIWIGFDHILFLLSLLLPAVFVRRDGGWAPAESLRGALLEVGKVVTAFTLAHSVTLALAALGVVTIPSRWVESAIAASVVAAAFNNVVPVFAARRWPMAFGFGLIHGFGFASVLADLGLEPGSLAVSLIAFNAGVELGQLAVVAAFLPLAWWLRQGPIYRRVVFAGGSVAVMAVAAVWFVERAFDLKFVV